MENAKITLKRGKKGKKKGKNAQKHKKKSRTFFFSEKSTLMCATIAKIKSNSGRNSSRTSDIVRLKNVSVKRITWKSTKMFYQGIAKKLFLKNTMMWYIKWKMQTSSSFKQFYLSKITLFEIFILLVPVLTSTCTFSGCHLIVHKVQGRPSCS